MNKEEKIEQLEKAILCIAINTYGNADKLPRLVNEILNPPNPKKFIECDTCRAKPGSPTLCSGCLHNRALISKLKKE